jgi:hypothetical protein
MQARFQWTTYACGMPRKAIDPRPRAELMKQMAALNLRIGEARRTLPTNHIEVKRLSRQLKMLQAKFLR